MGSLTTVPALLPGSSTTTVYYAAIPAILVGIFFRPRLVLMAIVITPIYFILLYQLLVALNVDVVLTSRQLINAVQFLIVVDFLLFVFIEYVQSLANLRAERLIAANEALRKTEASLEQRVAERTRELEIAKAQTERFYRISAAMNRSSTYTDILKAVSDGSTPPPTPSPSCSTTFPPATDACSGG
ncbi:MAG: hypothetical protein IPK19_27495 [Chloroflexi bacterium]|nr:hypothetical protein [Chloroflexota bacterium]